MNFLNPSEITRACSEAAKKKAAKTWYNTLASAFLAGLLIAFCGAASSTVSFAMPGLSSQRLAGGFVFAFGLGVCVLLGAELFTGNMLMIIGVMDREITLRAMLRNWLTVYLGNFAGALTAAAGFVYFGGLKTESHAAYMAGAAAAKGTMPLQNAFVLGIFCNVLVCAGVLCAASAKDTWGKIIGAYAPVALFVICGFEHSVANMFTLPAGYFAANMFDVSSAAAPLGGAALRLAAVTAGNILGGIGLGALMRKISRN